MTPCKTCNGQGMVQRIICRRGDVHIERPVCPQCNGGGWITEQEAAALAKRAELVNARKHYRDMRVGARISQMAAGAAVNVHPSRIYQWESFGVDLPDGVEARYLAWLTEQSEQRLSSARATPTA